MGDILAFRRMITPIIIQIIFWIGIVGILILGLVAIIDGASGESDGGAVLLGFLFIIFGPMIWRAFFEIMMLIYRIIERLSNLLTEKTSTERP